MAQRLAGDYPEYVGTIAGKRTPRDVAKARRIFFCQKTRCTNPKVREYRYYGGKGIRQEYTLRQFIYWFINHPDLQNLRSASVDRLDHNRNYGFDNIRLIERSENAKERNSRFGNPSKVLNRPVVVFDEKSCAPLVIAPSIQVASYLTGVIDTTISAIGKFHEHRKFSQGYTFRYLEDTQYGTA